MKLRHSNFTAISVILTAVLLSQAAPAQTVKTLYSFTGANSSGNPGLGTLAQGRNGKLYGTTIGPNGDAGSAFSITTGGNASEVYAFGSDGTNPWGGLTLGQDGYYYGTAFEGGSSGNGVLFKLSPTGAYTSLHEFDGGSDGAFPLSPPIQASDSNFYGTTSGTNGSSTVYRYEPNGTFTTISNLSSAQGSYVIAPLTQGSDGNLYGTASDGGSTDGCGTIFKLSTAGQILWTYAFPCGKGGSVPYAALLQASDGNFYGTTISGGIDGGVQPGTVFRLSQNGIVTILYAFKNPIDGSGPAGSLTQGTDGNLYGTTLGGDGGTIFELTLSGTHTILHRFGSSGKDPYAGVMQDTNGTFYGTTYAGGRSGFGTVYSLNMGLGPFVTFVQPTGAAGSGAQILGQGLTGSTSVTFNGVAATSFKVVNDTYMTAVVPTGAITGKVVVTTPGGTLTSNVNFRILQ
jgi:uncharacterized repeat protein (TIGR03803 family)